MQNRTYAQGAEILQAGVSYRTYATGKTKVSVVILDPAGKELREIPMTVEPSGYYSVVDPESRARTLYKYRLDQALLPDPASRFQPFGVHGPAEVVDPTTYQWKVGEWPRPAVRDLVIYEAHLGTLTETGTFLSAIEKLDYLVELGVKALEIMPVADFPGNWNWGYDGVLLYAPSRAYGRPDDFRALVDAAHAKGLIVLLDVVYNHLGPDGNYLGSYGPEYFHASHDTPWGAGFNFDGSTAARRLFSDNALYWIREFRIDGFRLDATQAILDDSDKHIIQEITENVQQLGGLVICEDPRNERRIILPRSEGGYGCDATWADDFHHVVRVQITGENEGYLGYFGGTMEELQTTLSEGWLFTGQLQKDDIPRGTRGSDLPPERFVYCISNHDQVGNRAYGDRLSHIVSPAAYRAASALLLLAPYTPMLFMGQEFAASSSFCYFTDHHEELGRGVTKGRRKEFAEFSGFRDPRKRALIPDPQAESTFRRSKLSWSDLEKTEHRRVWQLYVDFLRYRKDHLSERERGTWRIERVSSNVLALRYGVRENQDQLVLIKLLPEPATIEISPEILRSERTWRCALSSNAAIYGGDGPAQYDSERNLFVLTNPEVVVFQEE
jgi:maltooligosyltrehalose trehalohydrolase